MDCYVELLIHREDSDITCILNENYAEGRFTLIHEKNTGQRVVSVIFVLPLVALLASPVKFNALGISSQR